MTSIVTLDERKARALSARKAALAQYGGRYWLFGSAARDVRRVGINPPGNDGGRDGSGAAAIGGSS